MALGLPVPIVSQYYRQLAAIDAELARPEYPINVAIRRALEGVMHYYSYRPRPRRIREVGQGSPMEKGNSRGRFWGKIQESGGFFGTSAKKSLFLWYAPAGAGPAGFAR